MRFRLPWNIGNLWSRRGSGRYSAWQEHRAEALVGIEELGWNEYDNRRIRYGHYESYYYNVAYDAIKASFDIYREDLGLYRDIRLVYNPVTRLVNTFAAKIYPGKLGTDDLKEGAIPIAEADDKTQKAIKRLWRDSAWGRQKSVFVRSGSMLGDAVIKLVTDYENERIIMQPIHPGKIADIERDDAGQIKTAVISYERSDNPRIFYEKGRLMSDEESDIYTYTELIERDWVTTFKDDEEYPFYTNAAGKKVSRYRNKYGFVPLSVGPHMDIGLTYGANSFFNSVRKIDELNDLASLIDDAIRRNVDNVYFFAGVTGKSSLRSPEGRERDEVLALYAKDANAKAQSLSPQLDIKSALEALVELQGEIEKDNPILAFPTIRSQVRDVSGIAVQVLYSDAAGVFADAGENYDDILVQAHKMGFAMGAVEGWDDYESFADDTFLISNDTGHHSILARPVVKDEISEHDKVNFLIQSNAPQDMTWQALGYDDDQIEEFKNSALEQQEAFNDLQVAFQDKLPKPAAGSSTSAGAKNNTGKSSRTIGQKSSSVKPVGGGNK